jgi:hypothetical protein
MENRKSVYKGLQFIDVWFTDTSLTSPDYFQITDFPTRLTAGKNILKLLYIIRLLIILTKIKLV